MTSPEPTLRRELSLRDLVLFNVAAIVSTRWIGVAAHVGPGTILLWLLAAALFLVPCAFVVAESVPSLPARRRPVHLDSRSVWRVAGVRLRLVLLFEQRFLDSGSIDLNGGHDHLCIQPALGKAG